MGWTVYMLLCNDGSYYVGMTGNLTRRLEEHRTHEGAKYTRDIGVVNLVWQEFHPTPESAHRRELQLKRWTRRKKEALISGDLKLLKAL